MQSLPVTLPTKKGSIPKFGFFMSFPKETHVFI
jgi:hypothetical protein